MKNNKKLYLLPVFILILHVNAYSWEIYDRIIATVNDTPLVQSELNTKYDKMVSTKKITPKKQSSEDKSRILDNFINEAILEETAMQQSIEVTDDRLNDQIKKIMAENNFKSADDFKKEIEKKENLTFDEYKEELRKSIITKDVMSIAIGISPPSQKDAEIWYNANKQKVGYEVNYQHIMINLANESFEENKRANKILSELLNKITKGQSFENTAREFSEDKNTKNSGGSVGWIALSNLARKDMVLANNIYMEFIKNKNKYAIVKSETAYHLIKFNGSRITPFENAKNDIFNLLYQQKITEQFNKWIEQKKKESDIKIYLEDYIKDKSNTGKTTGGLSG